MAIHPRNLLLFAALAGAAVLTWMLAGERDAPDDVRTAIEPAPPGWYLVDAVLSGTDEDGRIYYRIIAERVEQRAEDDNLELENMTVEYAPESQVRWSISAARGVAPASRAYLQLLDDVRLVREPEANEDETVVEMRELQLFTDEFRASSDGLIAMHNGALDFTATGLSIDLQEDSWKLDSDVTIRYAR
jgi:LPS export ABC transporter protein LptC